MKKITVIAKLLTSLPELAQWVLDNMGEGARPDAEHDLYFFAFNSTPVQNGYIRIPCAEHIATALQWMQDEGITSEHGEVVRIEWHGQDKVQTGTDEDGNPVIEEQLFQTGTRENEDGTTSPIYLGRIS